MTDEVRSLASHIELLFVAVKCPVLAQKLRYFTDGEFQGLFEKAAYGDVSLPSSRAGLAKCPL